MHTLSIVDSEFPALRVITILDTDKYYQYIAKTSYLKVDEALLTIKQFNNLLFQKGGCIPPPP